MTSGINFICFIISISCVKLTVTSCPYDASCDINCPPACDSCCICSDRIATCKNLQTIPPLLTGPNVTDTSMLIFDYGNINNVPSHSLPPGLLSLTFNDHPLTNISPDAFEDSPRLKGLEFRRTKFTKLPEALFQLRNLSWLTIIDTHIDMWNTTILEHIGSPIEMLTLQNVGLSSWPSWIPFFHSLEILDLSFNPLILSVPDDAFSPLEQTLKSIYLYDTGLTKLPDTANIPGLVSLRVSNNKISQLTSDRLSPSILDLDLRNNSVIEITDTSFRKNFLLQKLNLDYNPLTTIWLSSFENLLNLSDLSLSYTRLTEIPLALTSLTTLKSLGLTKVAQISCPHPPRQELVQWFKSYNGMLRVSGACPSGQKFESYLNGFSITSTVHGNSVVSVFMCVFLLLFEIGI